MAAKLKTLNLLSIVLCTILMLAGGAVYAATPNPSSGPTQDQLINNTLKNNKIVTDLNLIVAALSAVVSIVIIGSLIVGGIQYSMAGSSPDAIGKAKKRIFDAVLALFIFLFLFAILQWLIPGGL